MDIRSLIPFADFKAVLSIDDRDDVLSVLRLPFCYKRLLPFMTAPRGTGTPLLKWRRGYRK
jgi:hypothetical protein